MAARLTVVGSSDAFNAAGRSHSCYLLDGDGFEPIMVDFGATALCSLRRLERDPTDIAAWVITHLHGDHIGGFPFLLIDAMFNAIRSAPLEVLGPAGVEKRVMDLFEVAYGDVIDRERPYELTFRELLPGGRSALQGTTVSGYPAEHMDPPEQPLCLRVDLPSGQRVAFSGDTAMCDGLLEAADGVDLLVAECSALAPPCGRHCSWEDWMEALPKLTAKRVLLTHLSDAVRANADRLLAEAPDGVDLAFADDGMEITL